jgi:hypothetical protein
MQNLIKIYFFERTGLGEKRHSDSDSMKDVSLKSSVPDL